MLYIPFINLLYNFSTCFISYGNSYYAISAALPKPTHKCGANVPLLNPRSYPPPCIIYYNLTLGFLLTYNAPIPFGPYNLCADILAKSISKS